MRPSTKERRRCSTPTRACPCEGRGQPVRQPRVHADTPDRGVKISMDGRGRYQDNIFVERLWRTVKYEEVYLKAYANGLEARNELREYLRFYNERRPHQALGYRTPAEVFYGEPVEEDEDLKERRCSDQPDLVSYGGVQESHLIVA